MTNPDPIQDALKRLAAVADSDPVLDPLPGIRAEARRNRNRAAALSAAGVAAAVLIGFAGWAALPGGGRADDPGYVSSPTAPSPSPSPTVALSALDTGSADVDGDGRPDQVALLVPRDTATGDPATQSWLQVKTGTGTQLVQVLDTTSYVAFLDPGLVDLDGNGASDILLFTSAGGDSGEATIWTWVDGRLTRATAAADSPADLVTPSGLASYAETVGVSFKHGQLFSWQVLRSGSQEAKVWQWTLSGATLTARQLPGTQCVSMGAIKPC